MSPSPALEYQHWRLAKDQDGIAWLTLDHATEAVNTLGSPVMAELDQIVGHLEAEHPKALILVSGKPKNFIVGADVREFDATDKVSELEDNVRRVHGLFKRIEDLPFPTVVAFEGYCLGGGLELALCFDWRIALDAEHTRIGFPEVKLGIYPGFGGSGRAVWTMGALNAMPIMLTGRMLRASAAKGLGLVDQTVSRHGSLRWAARAAALKGKKHKPLSWLQRLLLTGPARRLLAGQMRKQTAAKARRDHYPAPFELIDAFEAAGNHKHQMIALEAEKVPRLLVGETSTNLRRVFRLMEMLKQQGKRSQFHARSVHVIGAGVMGGDIAAWCALRGLYVTLQDREMKYIEPALSRAHQLFKRKLKKRSAVAAAKARLVADPEGAGIGRADVIIEAIFENADAKRALFSDVEKQAKASALLATNTSAIPLSEIAQVLKDPNRLVGLHFFNPVAQMPLVEVVYDTHTQPKCVDDAASFATQIGKYALPVTSTPGFLVNRVLAPYMRHAMLLHREGIPKEAIDKAAEAFGMPMGPVELADTVGLDVGLGVITTLMGEAAAEDKQVLQTMVDKGQLGKKSGQGFYTWKKGKAQKDPQGHRGHDLVALGERLMAPYFQECQACLADQVVANADLLDAGMIFGTGYAPFKGGPLHTLQTQAHQNATATETALSEAQETTS